MNIASIAAAAFPVAIFIVIVTIGLGTRPRDALYVTERPDLVGRGLVAAFVVVPAIVMLVTYFWPIPEPAEAALIALSVSPMLPVLPKQLAKMGIEGRLAVSLDIFTVVAAIIVTPVVFGIVSSITGYALDVGARHLLQSMMTGVVLPLVIGMAVNMAAPRFAERVANPLFAAAMAVLVLAVIVAFWNMRGLIAAQFTPLVLAAIVILLVSGLVAGHVLGAPARTERMALALTASSRHPGFAIAVGTAVAPRGAAAVVGVVLIYFILRGVAASAYVKHVGHVADVAASSDA